MMHIVEQTIPQQVINNPEYDWAPYANKITKGGVSEEVKPEGEKRYEVLLDQFKAQKAMNVTGCRGEDLYKSYAGRLNFRVYIDGTGRCLSLPVSYRAYEVTRHSLPDPKVCY